MFTGTSLAGVERLKVAQRSLSERSNTSGSNCANCGNCTLNAISGGQIFLSGKRSNCLTPRVARTWVIDSGRSGHVVQLTVERQQAEATTTPEIVKHELKVTNSCG